MSKFYGVIGFSITKKTAPGVFTPSITELSYKGDVLSNTRRYEARSDSTNDDLLINNRISILSDSFTDENIGHILYVVYGNTKWKVTNIEVNRPRLILTLGGVYNG